MAFRFSLETVLKYRAELERREELALEVRRGAVAQLEQRLAQTRDQRECICADRYGLLERGTLGDDIAFSVEREEKLKRLEVALSTQLSAARQSYAEQMQAYLGARQRRECLAELKKDRHERYSTMEEHRDQQRIDEIIGARYKHDT